MRIIRCFAMAVCMAAAASRVATAQDFDVRPIVVGGVITTNGYDDATGDVQLGQRVFLYAFQEDPGDPFFTSDPGFNAAVGSGLSVGSVVSFNVRSGGHVGLPANLTYWDGTGTPNFGLVPHGESLDYLLGSSKTTIGNTLGDQPGFKLQTVASGGAIHKHLSAFLNGTGGSNPTEGVYLLMMELLSSDPGTAKSLPFAVLYGNFADGIAPVQADAAMAYAEALLVPEPSSIALAFGMGLGLVGIMAVRARMRR